MDQLDDCKPATPLGYLKGEVAHEGALVCGQEEDTMDVPDEAMLLRIFTSSADRYELGSLYIAIVEATRRCGLAGATVLRGQLGYGHTHHLRQRKFLPFSEDHPVVIEIVDTPAKIAAFLPILDEMMESGLVTLEQARVLHYGRTKTGRVLEFLRCIRRYGLNHWRAICAAALHRRIVQRDLTASGFLTRTGQRPNNCMKEMESSLTAILDDDSYQTHVAGQCHA